MSHSLTVGQTVFKALGPRKILLAEDVESGKYTGSQMLQSWGIEVTVARSEKELMENLQNQFIDCILMDIQSPGGGFVETVGHIRKLKDPAKASIPIIVLTANTLKGDGEEYLEGGMTHLLTKPFTQEDLYQMLSKTFAHKPDAGSENNTRQEDGFKAGEEEPGKPYDLTMVESLSGGDQEFIKKMAALFIETIPSNVDALKLALKNEDWEQVSKMAHKLKSSIDSMGIKSLKTGIREVESNAKKLESLDKIPLLVQQIDRVINNCINELRIEFHL